MDLILEYTGNRGETLTKYNQPTFRGGPYDFSKGKAKVDEKDAEVILRENPVAFKSLGPAPVEKKKPAPVPAKASKPGAAGKPAEK